MNINMELKPEMVAEVVKSVMTPIFDLQMKKIEASEKVTMACMTQIEHYVDEFLKAVERSEARREKRWEEEKAERAADRAQHQHGKSEAIRKIEEEIELLELEERKRELEKRLAKKNKED